MWVPGMRHGKGIAIRKHKGFVRMNDTLMVWTLSKKQSDITRSGLAKLQPDSHGCFASSYIPVPPAMCCILLHVVSENVTLLKQGCMHDHARMDRVHDHAGVHLDVQATGPGCAASRMQNIQTALMQLAS